MKSYTKNEIKVGVVSILGLLVLVGIIVYVKGISFTNKPIPVLFVFDNSYGISAGAPVVVNGIKRGYVEDVWNTDGQVFISTELTDISDLRADVSAVISMLELMGGKKIEVFAGDSDAPYNPNNQIIGKPSTDISALFLSIGDITGNLTSIVVKLDTILSKTANIVSDTTFTNELYAIIRNTSTVTADLKDLLSRNNQNIDIVINNLTKMSSDLKATIDSNSPYIGTIVNNLDTASIQLKSVLSKTDTTLNDANRLLSDIKSIVSDIKSDNGGALSKIIYDKQFANKLDTLVGSVDALAKQIKEHGINANVRLGGRP